MGSNLRPPLPVSAAEFNRSANMKRGIGILLIPSVLLLSGCILLPIPHEQWLSPRYHGVIMDADTGKPLGGVQVTLRGYRYAEEEIGSVVARSDDTGHYSVVASRRSNWLPIWLGPAEGTQEGTVIFEHDGYVATEVKQGRFTGAMSRTEFEVDVRLQQTEPNSEPPETTRGK